VVPPRNDAGLPPYTIIMGHTRRAILMELGIAESEVVVRYDLARATRVRVKELFLLDNVARRQQDRLGLARAAIGLFEIERANKGGRVSRDLLGEEEVRDRVGKIIGMSGRNLQRYLCILKAPVEVQNAHADGLLTLVQASRVATLSETEQRQLAARLRGGEDAKKVFLNYFPFRANEHVKVGNAVASFARALDAAKADLSERLDQVRAGQVRRHEAALRRGRELIRQLLGVLGGRAEWT
jgi:hypothetical protein